MPTTFLIDQRDPDTRKAWPVHLSVEEWVLEIVNGHIINEQRAYPLLQKTLRPYDDFVIPISEISMLQNELNDYYQLISQSDTLAINWEVITFYHLLSALCLAAEKTKSNLYGFGD